MVSTIYYPYFLNLFPPPIETVKTPDFSKLITISRYMSSRCNETVLYGSTGERAGAQHVFV